MSDKIISIDSLKYYNDKINQTKQDVLISGQNIKTINGESIIGSGNIEISSGNPDANVMAVDTEDTIDDVNVEYATKEEVAQKQDIISDIDNIRSGAAKGATALQSIPSEYVTETELSNKGYATISALNNKVDVINGKQLSTEDFTTALKTKLEGLNNYDDTELSNAIETLRGDFNNIVSGDTTTAIKTFNEVIAFLDGLTDTQDLESIIASIEQQIAGKMDKVTLAAVATSGNYNDLSNKPTIPSFNFKTINGESILGSGDITISGGSSSGSSAYAEVSHGTSDTTFTLTPNVFHIWDEVTELTLTLGSETSGVANEYLFQFTSGSEPTVLSLPDDIKWANDETPVIEANKIYQISILKGLGSVMSWDNAPTLIDNKVTVSISGTEYLVSLQYAAASDIVVKVYTADGLRSVNVLSGEVSKTASSLGPMVDSDAYIESITPVVDNKYNYIW